MVADDDAESEWEKANDPVKDGSDVEEAGKTSV